jgi:hypothetical protein
MNAMVTTTGSNAMTPTSMDAAIKLAEMMARGKLVPAHLHNSPGDCLMVVEQALRWQMSPFAVAQCTSVIQGKLMFEGKLVAAALNASGVLSSRLDYEFSGANGQRAVTVRGTLRGETKPRDVTVFLQDAKTTNGMWVKQPDQQLVYAATRVWARRHAPEVMLGVYAPEEFDRAEAFAGTTLDAEPEAPPLRAAAAATPRADRIAEKAPAYEAPPQPKQTIGQYLDALEIAMRDCDTLAAVNRLIASPKVVQARQTLKNGALERLERIIADGIAAHAPVTYPDPTDDTEALPEDERADEPV